MSFMLLKMRTMNGVFWYSQKWGKKCWCNGRKLIPTCNMYIDNYLEPQSGRIQFMNPQQQPRTQHASSWVALFMVLIESSAKLGFFSSFSEMKLITMMLDPTYWCSTFQFIKENNFTRIILNIEFYLKNYIIIMPQGLATESDKSAYNVDFNYWSGQ